MSSGAGRAVLSTMLDRLLAGLMSGPNMNCRPHASRQRVDLAQLAKLGDVDAGGGAARAAGCGRGGPRRGAGSGAAAEEASTGRAGRRPRGDGGSGTSRRCWAKVRVIADEARTYENDTGVAALAVGFPLLSVPPADGEGKRVLAPVAFVPVSLAVKGGATAAVELAGRAEVGRPGAAERRPAGVGRAADRAGGAAGERRRFDDPWGELAGNWCGHVAAALGVADPFAAGPASPPSAPGAGGRWPVRPAEGRSAGGGTRGGRRRARSGDAEKGGHDAAVRVRAPAGAAGRRRRGRRGRGSCLAAVLGLFPVANQGLLRDTRAMMAEEPAGPVRAFLTAGIDFDAPPTPPADAAAAPVAEPVRWRARRGWRRRPTRARRGRWPWPGTAGRWSSTGRRARARARRSRT